jgi:hypothetical protein
MTSRIDADFTKYVLCKQQFQINTKQFTAFPRFYSRRLGTFCLVVKVYFYQHQRVCHVICSLRKMLLEFFIRFEYSCYKITGIVLLTQWAAAVHLYLLSFYLSSCFLCYQLFFRNGHFRSLTYWLRLLEARITNGTSRVMPPAVGDSPRHQQSAMIWGQQQSRGSGGHDMSLIHGH